MEDVIFKNQVISIYRQLRGGLRIECQGLVEGEDFLYYLGVPNHNPISQEKSEAIMSFSKKRHSSFLTEHLGIIKLFNWKMTQGGLYPFTFVLTSTEQRVKMVLPRLIAALIGFEVKGKRIEHLDSKTHNCKADNLRVVGKEHLEINPLMTSPTYE